jgi:hypothetical protein
MHDRLRDQRNQAMTFTFSFEPADWIDFNAHHLKNSRIHRRQRFWARMGFLSAFLVLSLVLVLTEEKGLGFAVCFSVVGVVGFLAYPSVYDDSVMKRIRRLADDPDNMKVFGTVSMTLSPEGLRVSRPGEETALAWSRVLRLVETADHVFLYVSALDAIIIPRRSLEGVSFDGVNSKLREYVGKATSVE